MQRPANTVREDIEVFSPLPPGQEVGLIEVPESTAAAKREALIPHRSSIVIDTIHGGSGIPIEFDGPIIRDEQGQLRNPMHWSLFRREYIREKDWGANQVAHALARELGVGKYTRVNIARVFLDYGRFPGDSPYGAGHLDRMAISGLCTRFFNHEQKTNLLTYFDTVSDAYEQAVVDAKLKIGVHTYDAHNIEGTQRPMVSLVYRTLSYENERRLPFDVFDKLYPAELAEFTADRRLIGRLVLDLEKAGISTALNHPYNLPDGSVEVRAQVWLFFRCVRLHFDEAHPELSDDIAYIKVWDMLLDTNLRNTDSVRIRSYLHMYRNPPPRRRKLFRAVRDAYEHIGRFINRDERRLVTYYRRSVKRPSSFALEVRKDLVWRCEDNDPMRPIESPGGARTDFINYLADVLADGIDRYFDERRDIPDLSNLLPEQA